MWLPSGASVVTSGLVSLDLHARGGGGSVQSLTGLGSTWEKKRVSSYTIHFGAGSAEAAAAVVGGGERGGRLE